MDMKEREWIKQGPLPNNAIGVFMSLLTLNKIMTSYRTENPMDPNTIDQLPSIYAKAANALKEAGVVDVPYDKVKNFVTSYTFVALKLSFVGNKEYMLSIGYSERAHALEKIIDAFENREYHTLILLWDTFDAKMQEMITLLKVKGPNWFYRSVPPSSGSN